MTPRLTIVSSNSNPTPTLRLAPPLRLVSSRSPLSKKELREAIKLGTKLAEDEARFKLAMKARQVAEHARSAKGIRVLTTAKIDGGAYRIVELPDHSARIEEWKPLERKWTPGGASLEEMMDWKPPVLPEFAARMGIPWSDVYVAPDAWAAAYAAARAGSPAA